MSKFLKLIGAVIAALVAFLKDKSAEAKIKQKDVEALNEKIAKARRDALADHDKRGGVPDENDPFLRD